MDDRGSLWARTSTQQQILIFAGIFVIAIVMLLWVTK